MHGSFKTEKMNPQVAAYDGKRGGWCDDGKMRAYLRKPDNSKPPRKGKSAYSSARKLKESTYVWSKQLLTS